MIDNMEFTYNDELLFDPKDLKTARDNYPDIAFALDHEELRNSFKTTDTIANAEKSKSRKRGILSVCLATSALLVAAFEPVIQAQFPHDGNWDWVPKGIAGVAALAGVIAVAIGYFGILFRKSKDQWLHHRLITERLRQWHAQSLVCNIAEIITAAQSDNGKTEFLVRRAVEFEEFKRHTINQVVAVFPRYIGKSPRYSKAQQENLLWIRSEWAETARDGEYDFDNPTLKQILAAYESIRIRSQIQYTSYKLKPEGERFWTHAGVQARVIGNVAFVCVIGLLLLHMLVLIGAVGDINWMKGPVVHTLAVSSAILALAGRTLGEGLQPRREIERLDAYLARLETAEQRFKNTKSVRVKIAAMREIEEATVAEMISFLKANKESKFVM